jgi:hypothetical protein
MVLDGVEQGTYQERGIGLVGPVGCGRTSLLVTAYKLVAPRLLEYLAVSAASIQFVSVPDLFDRLQSSFDEGKRTGNRATPSASSALSRLDCSSSMTWERSGLPSGREAQPNPLIDSRGLLLCCQPGSPRYSSLEELEQRLSPRTSSRLVYPGGCSGGDGACLGTKLCR